MQKNEGKLRAEYKVTRDSNPFNMIDGPSV